MAKKLTLRQTAIADYLKGCNVMDVKPENYKRWTIANIENKTEELRASWVHQCRAKRVDSVKANTRAVVETVVQAVGEPLEAARDRAVALARATGRAIPFTISRK